MPPGQRLGVDTGHVVEVVLRRKEFDSVKGVVDWRLCLGCGACAPICPQGRIELVDVVSQGVRPVVSEGDCQGCRDCLSVCPAYENDHRPLLSRAGAVEEVEAAYGPVLEMWEGHASDPEIRYLGSSGGLLTALALHCLTDEGMQGVIHVAGDPSDPIRNVTRLSRNREELLSATGSRYSPASACDALGWLDTFEGPCVFVGQPSEVTALRKAQRLRPNWDRRVGLSLSFFCAGSPSTRGTQALLASSGIGPHDVAEVRYRGRGWPGWFGVRRSAGGEFEPLQTYAQSWDFLQRYRPFSVNLTPDGSGEDADISCGDPWYRAVGRDEPGSSLILVRSPRGREIMRRAQAAGVITLRPIDAEKALASQRNLIAKRGAIWGRLVALRLFGLPVPRLHGFSLLRHWIRLPLIEKGQSLLGTIRRIVRRGWYRPQVIDPTEVVHRMRPSATPLQDLSNVEGRG